MIFKYGGSSFESETAECLPEHFSQRRVYNQRGRAQTLVKTLVVRFDVVKTSQATIHARLQQLESAFALEGGEAKFVLDDGANSIYHLPVGSRGVRIVDNTLWTEDGKAHYVTGHPARITFQAEYTVDDADPLTHFDQTITRIGNGGPRRVQLDLDIGEPAEQIVSTHSSVFFIQTGECVGHLTYQWVFLPPPIFPAYLENPEESVSVSTPRWDGLRQVDYPFRWQYRMTLPFNPGNQIPVNH